MLDSTASEEVVHRRSDSVGSGSTTSGLESLLGSDDTHGCESAPRVGSKPAGIGHGADADSSPSPVVGPQLRSPPKQAGELDSLDAPPSNSMEGKSGGLKAQSKGVPAEVRVLLPSEHFISRRWPVCN